MVCVAKIAEEGDHDLKEYRVFVRWNVAQKSASEDPHTDFNNARIYRHACGMHSARKAHAHGTAHDQCARHMRTAALQQDDVRSYQDDMHESNETKAHRVASSLTMHVDLGITRSVCSNIVKLSWDLHSCVI